MMERALKYCAVALESPEAHQQFMVQYRVANINHRLASLFHNAFRSEVQLLRSQASTIDFLELDFVIQSSQLLIMLIAGN
jgi:hypothetical protein